MAIEFIDIVNEQDQVIGRASRDDIYKNCYAHRIVHVLVFTGENKIALQRQSESKSFCPLHWNSTAAGHVRSGETYEQAALRELWAEAGIKIELSPIGKDTYANPVNNNFIKYIASYQGQYSGSFKVNPFEVDKICYFSEAEIKAMMVKGEKFHPELLFILKKHFNFI